MKINVLFHNKITEILINRKFDESEGDDIQVCPISDYISSAENLKKNDEHEVVKNIGKGNSIIDEAIKRGKLQVAILDHDAFKEGVFMPNEDYSEVEFWELAMDGSINPMHTIRMLALKNYSDLWDCPELMDHAQQL